MNVNKTKSNGIRLIEIKKNNSLFLRSSFNLLLLEIKSIIKKNGVSINSCFKIKKIGLIK